MSRPAEIPLLASPASPERVFRDPWSQIALSLAELSIELTSEMVKPPPLYVSLVIDENALLAQDALDEFLDIVTQWQDVTGFYIVMRANDSGFPCVIQDRAIAGLIYLTHVLAVVNEFEVLAGYSDLVGTLLHAAGATYTASGWFNSLRQFSLARFQPAGGGRQPRPRYTSGPLLTPILVIPELETIQRLGRIKTVLSRTSYDAAFASLPVGRVQWTRRESQLHHWAVLRSLVDKVRAPRTPKTRFVGAQEMVAEAQLLFGELIGLGAAFESSTGGRHLEGWLRGLETVRPILFP